MEKLIQEICRYRPKSSEEIKTLRTFSVDMLKKKALSAKREYYSEDEGVVLNGHLNVVD